jgi:hypothetical protein
MESTIGSTAIARTEQLESMTEADSTWTTTDLCSQCPELNLAKSTTILERAASLKILSGSPFLLYQFFLSCAKRRRCFSGLAPSREHSLCIDYPIA